MYCGHDTAEPRSLLVIGLIVLFVAAVGVTVAYFAIPVELADQRHASGSAARSS
ncbi:MAG: hypothetical protein L0Y54_02615 [Sporichthyaceae bacterium]|nr:hypothetical protein [Sporichthyaceae bacterium]